MLSAELRGLLATGQQVPRFSAMLAEQQTKGRGRLGREWIAPRSSQLILSVGARLTGVDVGRSLGLLPLLAGIAAAEAVRELRLGEQRLGEPGAEPASATSASAEPAVPAELKWPNDLLVGGRKLGGILVEAVALEPEPVVVIGIGINVNQQRAELPVGHATSLALESTEQLSADLRSRLAIAVVGRLLDSLRRFQQYSGAAHTVLPRYRQLCTTLGTEVSVHLPDGTITQGVARDLDDTGALVVAVPGQADLVVSAGDVTHLRPVSGGYAQPTAGEAE